MKFRMNKIEEALTRGVEKIYPSRQELEKVLRLGKKLRIYQGFDPTMPNLHLGHCVGLLKLRQFQDLGHEVIFLVGDFTGMIGDPTDKAAVRKQLTRKQVLENCRNWKKQAGNILRFTGKNPAKILYNSQWLSKLSFAELLNLAHHLTYQQTIKRNMFRERLRQDKDIYLHEFLYPLMQGYDSVAMDIDLEVGGSDQTFNMLVGRDLMHKMKKKEKFVLTTKLLVDSKGEKVGKTAGNALFLNASAIDMFGGIMSFPDEVIFLGFELLTEVNLEGLEEKIKQNPMAEKKHLAFEIVSLLWGQQQAQKAQKEFEQVFQEGRTPKKPPVFKAKKQSYNIVDLLIESKLVPSRSEAKRLILQKAIDLDGKLIRDSQTSVKIKSGMVIRVGKRRFVKIRVL